MQIAHCEGSSPDWSALRIKAPFPALSPRAQAVPESPARTHFRFAARPGALNIAIRHPSRDARDTEGLTMASHRATADPAGPMG